MNRINTTKEIIQENDFNKLTIEEIILAGAREKVMIELIKERKQYLKNHEYLLTESNLNAIVANGFGKDVSITTPLGSLQVKKPRTRNRGNILNEDGNLENFESSIIPSYMKRSLTLEETIPLLYLHGLSTNDFIPALKALLGNKAAGLSSANIAKMMYRWKDELTEWKERDLSEKEFCYMWVDGIYFTTRNSSEKLCILVLLGATREGKKELVGVAAGYRESKESWLTLLRNLKSKGLKCPKLFIGDGALGFWSAVREVYQGFKEQRCWVHKERNVLDKLPKSVQPQAKSMMHEIYLSPTKEKANVAFNRFIKTFEDKYPKAVECLVKDRIKLMMFYDFPAAHWIHIRTTNPIESTFSTVRLRTKKTRGNSSRGMTEAMVFQLIKKAEKRWRKLKGYSHIEKVFLGVEYIDGVEKKAA
jgi:putative transposase